MKKLITIYIEEPAGEGDTGLYYTLHREFRDRSAVRQVEVLQDIKDCIEGVQCCAMYGDYEKHNAA